MTVHSNDSTGVSQQADTERRGGARQRTLYAATIAFNERRSTIDCTVRNLSEGGARLLFADSVTLPNEFDLIIPQRHIDRPARIMWRKGKEAGVAFM